MAEVPLDHLAEVDGETQVGVDLAQFPIATVERLPHLKQIEALFLRGRWRRDEHAWAVWQGIEPLIPTRFPGEWERMQIAGHVVRIYQRAHRSTKAVVYFGSVLGTQATWWSSMRPPAKKWVVVEAHLWLPPGTHSERQVLWIDRWVSWAPADTAMRALRHQRKLKRTRGSPLSCLPRRGSFCQARCKFIGCEGHVYSRP